MTGPTFVVCGHVTLDRLGGALVPGGTAYYAARALAALGARARVFTAAGPDFPAAALSGIEAVVAPAGATTAFVNEYAPGGRRTQRVLAAAPPLDAGLLPPAWRAPDVLLLAPVLGEVDVLAFSSAAGGRLVALCVQGVVRELAANGQVRARPLPAGGAALARVGAAIVGEDEARGDPGLVARLVAAIPVVAHTQGAHGSVIHARGRSTRVGVHPAREVDPTGAGDVFAAAFLLGLSRGDDPVEAARLGAAAASIAVEGRGGESLDRIGEAHERVARVPVVA